MAHYSVTCINKRQHYNPYERIEAIGGSGWKHLEDDAIRRIDTKTDTYSVTRADQTVPVITAVHLGRKYLKTAPDGISPDNLLALPECS